MKFSATLIALVAAGVANAQLPDVPACSLNCFVSALTTDGCSSLTDFACHCSKPQLVSDITPCVKKACKVPDQISVSNAVVAQCSSAGVPIVVPPIETAVASSASSASSAAPTSAAETSAAETTVAVAPSSSEEASSSVVLTPVTTTGWAVSTPAWGSSSAWGSSAMTSTPVGSKPTASSSGTAAATTSPAFNAAGSIKGNMAGVAAAAAVAAYIL